MRARFAAGDHLRGTAAGTRLYSAVASVAAGARIQPLKSAPLKRYREEWGRLPTASITDDDVADLLIRLGQPMRFTTCHRGRVKKDRAVLVPLS